MNFLRIVPALLLLTACASAQQRADERWSIEVPLGVRPPEAFKQTMTAFIASGLVVAQADAASGIISSVPKVSGGLFTLATTYRANILATSDSASRVILSGGWTSKDVDQFASSLSRSRVATDEKPLGSGMGAWKLLEHIAGTLDGSIH